MARNQDWGVRFIGSFGTSQMTIPEQWWKARRLPVPAPTAKGAIFEIKNMVTGESRYFSYSGGGLATSIGGPVQGSADVTGGFTEFITDRPVDFGDFAGPTHLHNVSMALGGGYSHGTLVFNDRIVVQGRGFWQTLWWGESGVDVSGPLAGFHVDVSSTIGGLKDIAPGHAPERPQDLPRRLEPERVIADVPDDMPPPSPARSAADPGRTYRADYGWLNPQEPPETQERPQTRIADKSQTEQSFTPEYGWLSPQEELQQDPGGGRGVFEPAPDADQPDRRPEFGRPGSFRSGSFQQPGSTPSPGSFQCPEPPAPPEPPPAWR